MNLKHYTQPKFESYKHKIQMIISNIFNITPFTFQVSFMELSNSFINVNELSEVQ